MRTNISPFQARTEVYKQIVAEWEAQGYDTARIIRDNQKAVDPSTGGVEAPTGNDPWCVLYIRNDKEISRSIGRRGKIVNGAVCLVAVYTPPFKGMETLDTVARSLRDRLRTTRQKGLWFTSASYREIGSNGTWNMARVEGQFRYQEHL